MKVRSAGRERALAETTKGEAACCFFFYGKLQRQMQQVRKGKQRKGFLEQALLAECLLAITYVCLEEAKFKSKEKIRV